MLRGGCGSKKEGRDNGNLELGIIVVKYEQNGHVYKPEKDVVDETTDFWKGRGS